MRSCSTREFLAATFILSVCSVDFLLYKISKILYFNRDPDC